MSVAALMYAASSEARKTTALATSSGMQSLGIRYSASDASMYTGVALSTAPGVSVTAPSCLSVEKLIVVSAWTYIVASRVDNDYPFGRDRAAQRTPGGPS